MTTPSFRAIALTSLVGLALALPASLVAQRQTRTVFVEVLDASGVPVPNLTAADFEVREGDAVRSIASAALSNGPMRIMLLIDNTSAMTMYLGQMKTAFQAFADTIPEPHEIGIVTTGNIARTRLAPTADRAKIRSTINSLIVDGGGSAFFDGLRETESRHQKRPGVRWPVYALFVTDTNEISSLMQTEDYTRLATDLVLRATTVHAALIQRQGPTIGTQIAGNLAQTTGGALEQVTGNQGLSEKTKVLADRIMRDFDAMKTRYQIEYVSDAKYTGAVDVAVKREGTKGRVLARRSS